MLPVLIVVTVSWVYTFVNLSKLAPAGLPTFGASFEGEIKVTSDSSFEDAWP